MKTLERSKNASRNILFGAIFKMVSLLAPFILRTIIIKTIGVEYVGLNSLFSSILQVLNLAELGISSAIVFSMYGAIANNDKSLICQLMNLYKKVYRIIGGIIFVVGLSFVPFLSFFISGKTPSDINIYVLYLIFLANTCLTYFLFAYKTCLFTAHQRNDVPSRIGIVVSLFTYSIQGLLLILYKDYYLYVIILPISTILNNLVTSFLANKYYPDYKAGGSVSPSLKVEIRKKVSSLFLYRIGSVVLSSVDTIVISSFLGLSILGKYNNYFYIITAIFGFFEVYYNSVTAGIGNSIKTDSKEKNRKDFNKLLLFQGWVVSWCSACLLSLYQPFMSIWVGESLMFPFSVVVCLTLLFFSWKIVDVVNLYKNAAGLWEHDKWRPFVAAVVNLGLNLILVNVIGIYGIIISTIVSVSLVIFPWSSFVLFKHFFNEGDYKKQYKLYLIRVLSFFAISVLVSLFTFLVCEAIQLPGVLSFFIKLIICIFVPNMLLYILFSLFSDFKETKQWFFSIIGNLLRIK